MSFGRLKELHQKHKRWIPIVSFILGFLFDSFMLRRIDELSTLIQQACYLCIATGLVSIELVEETREIKAPKILSRIWQYREFLLHFLLGTLLNSYTIFFFKSASALTSLLFIGALVAILTVNEFLRFGKSQLQVHVALVSLCLISYLLSLAPIVLGFMGILPFFVSVSASLFIFTLYYGCIRPRLSGNPHLLHTHLLYPYATIHLIFIVLYFLNAIPPVPLAVSYMGIFHQVEKSEDGYQLSFTHPEWKFWEHGDETFLARPGDPIFCFAQIFSPTRFKENLQVRWLLWDEKKGWQSQDVIPLSVTGGRDQGYRVVIRKNNYQPGQWRVQIETTRNQEVGRLKFSVVADDTTDERSFHLALR